MLTRRLVLAAALLSLPLTAKPSHAGETFITVQSTTSTENSGLFGYLLPIFTKKTGIDVHVVAVGTGQAIKNAQNGDGDVLLVHSKADEEKFVAQQRAQRKAQRMLPQRGGELQAGGGNQAGGDGTHAA